MTARARPAPPGRWPPRLPRGVPRPSAIGAACPYLPGLLEFFRSAGAVAQQMRGEPAAVGVAELDLLGLVHHRRGAGRIIAASSEEPAQEGFYVRGACPVRLVGDAAAPVDSP